ncbi:MAG: flagellin [bacterium]|nr:flagellin [bacterium]
MRTNLPGLRVGRYLNLNQGGIRRALEKLSSGLRINRAGDDAAGLAVSEKLRARISGLGVDVENAQAGVSIVQTADQALQQVQAMVRRVRDLALLCGNGTITDGDREHYQAETDSLLTEIDRINTTTEYNGFRILGGTIGAWAKEGADERDILDESSFRATDDLKTTGAYDVEVLRAAERATARLEGMLMGIGNPPIDISSAGGFYGFSGATQEGTVTVKIEVDGKVVFADLDAREGAGDSLSSALDKINDAMSAAGIEATASYMPPMAASDIIIDASNVLPEPLETTVPLAWQNPAPLNWTVAPLGPKIYDPLGASVPNSLITIDFTSPTNFTVTGNVSGNLGTGTTGTNFIGGGVSFTVQPDGDYASGDRIELAINSSSRLSTITSGGVTGISAVGPSTDSIISDGGHSVDVENTSSVTGTDNSGVRGIAQIGAIDTSGVVGQPQVTAINTAGVLGSPQITNIDTSGVAPAATVTWNVAPNIPGADTLVNEIITLEYTGGTTWSITGSVSGNHSAMAAGTTHATNEGGAGGGAGIWMNLVQDPAFNVGDQIKLTTDSNVAPTVNWTVSPYVEAVNTVVNETITLELITDRNGAGAGDVWSITGSVSGNHSPMVAGTTHVLNEGSLGGGAGLWLNLADDAGYATGDTITITTSIVPPAVNWTTAPTAWPGETLVNETFTMTLISDRPGPVNDDYWSIVGSVSGPHTTMVAGSGHLTNNAPSGGGLFMKLTPDGDYYDNDVITIQTSRTVPPLAWNVAPQAVAGNTLLDEDIVLTLIADNGGPDEWTVTGTVSGNHINYFSGNTWTTLVGSNGGGSGLQFNLAQHANYQVGDRVVISTEYGRRARLDGGAWVSNINPSDTGVVLTDPGGSTLNVNFGPTITAGTETLTIDTNIGVDATIMPDQVWDTAPTLSGGGPFISQRYTLTLVTDNDGAADGGPDVWEVVGNFSGTHQNALSGVPYVSNSGSIGNGQGMSFTIEDDSKFQIGSAISVDVFVRPSISVTSNEKGSRYEIEMEVVHDTSNSECFGVSTALVWDGVTNKQIDVDTVIYDGNGNPFDDLDFEESTISIIDKLGNTYSIAIVNQDTIQDLLDAINGLSSTLSASFDRDERSITIKDTSIGNNKLTVSDTGSATLAEDLGIRGIVDGDTIVGHRISRVADTIVEITDPDGNTATVSNAWGAGGGAFGAVTNTDKALTSSSSENAGGIAGVGFSFNDKQLKTGDRFTLEAGKGTLRVQVGQAKGGDARASTEIGDTSTATLNLADNVTMSSQEEAWELINSGRLDEALDIVSKLRGGLGAFQNRLEHTIQNLGITQENLQTAESRIRDADLAASQMELMKRQIMQQFGLSSLSQSNIIAENVLSLLQ